MRGRRNLGCAAGRGGAGFNVLVVLTVLTTAAALAWMLLLPVAFAAQLRERTGFGVVLRSLVANPLTGRMELRGLVLTNPPAFPAREFLQVREFRVEADLLTLFSERPVFDEVVLDIAQLSLVQPAAGGSNAEQFQQELAAGAGAGRAAAPRFLIRRLRLRLERVTVADYSGATPVVRESAVAMDRTLTNVNDLKPLLPPEAWQSLAPLGAALSGLLPGDLERALREVARDGAERLKQAGRETREKARGLVEALEESKKP